MGESSRPGKEATEQAIAAPGQLDQAERRRGEEKRVDQVEGMAAEGRGHPANWRSLTLTLRRWAGPQAVVGAGCGRSPEPVSYTHLDVYTRQGNTPGGVFGIPRPDPRADALFKVGQNAGSDAAINIGFGGLGGLGGHCRFA